MPGYPSHSEAERALWTAVVRGRTDDLRLPVRLELRCGEQRRRKECRSLVGLICTIEGEGDVLAVRVGEHLDPDLISDARDRTGERVTGTLVSAHLQYLRRDHEALHEPALCDTHGALYLSLDDVLRALAVRQQRAQEAPPPGSKILKRRRDPPPSVVPDEWAPYSAQLPDEARPGEDEGAGAT